MVLRVLKSVLEKLGQHVGFCSNLQRELEASIRLQMRMNLYTESAYNAELDAMNDIKRIIRSKICIT